jgi:hypothetical protein
MGIDILPSDSCFAFKTGSAGDSVHRETSFFKASETKPGLCVKCLTDQFGPQALDTACGVFEDDARFNGCAKKALARHYFLFDAMSLGPCIIRNRGQCYVVQGRMVSDPCHRNRHQYGVLLSLNRRGILA